MNKDKMNRAIAEACGWTNVGIRLMRVHSGQPTLNGLPPDKQGPDANEWHYRNVPPYASCLNAMAEAEKTLTDDQWKDYIRNLEAVTEAEKMNEWMTCLRCAISASAHQRAEAFLRTLNLYQDTRES